MTYRGRIQGGVVVLDNPKGLAEGALVEVLLVSPPHERKAGVSLEKVMTLEELAGSAKGLPTDLADRHDHYRHERGL